MSSTRGTDPQTLLTIVVGILENQVLPATEGRGARSALQLVAGILDNLASRVEQNAELRSLDDQLARDLLAALPGSVAGDLPRDSRGETPDPGLHQVSLALKTLRDQPERLSDSAVSEWLTTCRAELGRRSDAEIARMRSTRYYTSLSSLA